MYNYSDSEIKKLLNELGGIPYSCLDDNKHKHICPNCGSGGKKTFRFTEKNCLVCTKCELRDFTHWYSFLANKFNLDGKETNQKLLQHLGKWTVDKYLKTKADMSIDVANFKQFDPPIKEIWNKQSLLNRPNKLVLTNIYEWRYPNGNLYGYVTRKDFSDSKLPMQIIYGESKLGIGWHQLNSALPNRPIFNSHNYSSDKKILFVEGERNCIEVQKVLGDEWCVLTVVGGTSESYTLNSDFSFIINHTSNIYLWRDNDEVGLKFAKLLTAQLPALKTIRIKKFIPVDAKEGYDLYDAIQEGWDKDDIVKCINKEIFETFTVTKKLTDKTLKANNSSAVNTVEAQERKLTSKELFLQYIRPQGMSEDGSCVLYPKRKKTIMYYPDSLLSRAITIIGMSSKELATECFPLYNEKFEVVGIDTSEAAEFIMQQCESRGIFNDNNIRGIGIFNDKDRIVINTGSKLIVNEEEIPYDDFKSKYTYRELGQDVIWYQDEATADDINTLMSLCSSLNWGDPLSKILYGGFITQAFLSPLYDWLSHLWIFGLHGNGKTTVQQTTKDILGPLCVSMSGLSSTAASITQKLANNPFAISFDEAESHTDKDYIKMQAVIDLARQATRKQSIYKGTPSGRAKQYFVNVPFILSSINYTLEHDSDRSRFALLELLPPTEEYAEGGAIYNEYCDAKSKITEDFSQRLITYCFKRASHVLSWTPIVKTALAANGFTMRLADQYAGLIAGMLIWSPDIFQCSNQDEVKEYINNFINIFSTSFTVIKSNIALQTDHGDMLANILNSAIHVEDIYKHNRLLIISDAIAMIASEKPTINDFDIETVQNVLQSFGIKYINGYIHIEDSNLKLSKLINLKNWRSKLISQPGAKHSTSLFGKACRRTTYLPVFGVIDIDKYSPIKLNNSSGDNFLSPF